MVVGDHSLASTPLKAAPASPNWRDDEGLSGRTGKQYQVIRIRRQDLVTVDRRLHERTVNHIGDARSTQEQPDSTRTVAGYLQFADASQSYRETRLASSVSPDLGDDTCGGEYIGLGARGPMQKRADLFTSALNCYERSGIKKETHFAEFEGPVMINRARSCAKMRACSSSLIAPNSSSSKASEPASATLLARARAASAI